MLPKVNIILEFFGLIRHFIEACVYKEPVAAYLPSVSNFQPKNMKYFIVSCILLASGVFSQGI